MVDSIGWKALRTLNRAPATVPAAPVRPTVPSTADEVATAGVARQLAATPPVDLERVARIKKAIANGDFPIVSSTIADRLLALKLEWNPNDVLHD